MSRRKEKFVARRGSPPENPAETPTALLDIVSDAAVTQLQLGTNRNTQRNASVVAQVDLSGAVPRRGGSADLRERSACVDRRQTPDIGADP